MSKSVRELRVIANTAAPFELISSSATGRETIVGFGVFGGATIEIQTQVTIGADSSAITTFPTDGTRTAQFSLEVNVGYKQPLFITVTNATAGTTDIFVKVVTAEV